MYKVNTFCFILGVENNFAVKKRALELIQQLRLQCFDPGLAARHRRRPADFTRERVLTFPIVMLLLLQKSLKSLQAHVQEFLWQWGGQSAGAPQVSGGALTHARAKLSARVFVELNRTAVLPTVYGPAHAALVRRWQGLRLLGVDSSLTRLPDSPALRAKFGVVAGGNQHGVQARYPEGRVSVLYDLLNQIALDAQLAPSRQAETELAVAHLPAVQTTDLVITDRGYSGYGWLARVRQAGGQFLGRCSRGSFASVQALFARDAADVSVIVQLSAPPDGRAECRAQGWPLVLMVRLVTVRLRTGELEVLATSLLDEQAYPTESFGPLYGQRWGQETYFGRLKGRLDLEHISGRTVAAVEQDIHALVLLSNVESVVIGPAQQQLAAESARRTLPVQVNRAVSLHALKSRLIDLLASAVPAEQVLEQLLRWFVQNPTRVRQNRKVPRRKFAHSRSYHYQRRVRKIVF
jgi:hypothetical protein